MKLEPERAFSKGSYDLEVQYFCSDLCQRTYEARLTWERDGTEEARRTYLDLLAQGHHSF
ncbi:MAG: hypothetical protein KGI98_02850 [Euryarchaeota archaeon]|nr:hypothetical protein [Euryarchaeota archaeon]